VVWVEVDPYSSAIVGVKYRFTYPIKNEPTSEADDVCRYIEDFDADACKAMFNSTSASTAYGIHYTNVYYLDNDDVLIEFQFLANPIIISGSSVFLRPIDALANFPAITIKSMQMELVETSPLASSTSYESKQSTPANYTMIAIAIGSICLVGLGYILLTRRR